MDGVVADWDRAATEFLKAPKSVEMAGEPEGRWPKDLWDRLKTQEHFYRNLPKMRQADRLVNLAREFRDQLDYTLLFLTAIPKDNDQHWAFWDKMMWAQENYPDVPVHFGPYSVDKQEHCLPGDILIDDRPDNCERWRKAGGEAIQVTKDYDLVLQETQRLLQVRTREARSATR
jgi:5'(3')-deoxyribonucleotidase